LNCRNNRHATPRPPSVEIIIMANYPEIELYIDGRWKRASGQPVINPADESVLGTVPTATTADLDDALAAAERGFATWRKTSPAKRAQIILKAASLIRRRVDDMAIAMTLEQGKPMDQARLEILRGCDIIEWDATEGLRLYGRVVPSEEGMRHTVLRQPIGPVAAFSPWNFPMSSPARKVAGALSSGCSIILKASEETPAGAVQLVRAFHDAGLPPGVLNLVFGNPAEISNYLIPQSSIRLITFTGSIPVGKALAEMAGRHMSPRSWNLAATPRSSSATTLTRSPPLRHPSPASRATQGKSVSRRHDFLFSNRFISALLIHSPRRLRS
jgi:succinate-semialdehyde dehydrogenase/glutarate-semialdehyde dehydrogenase